MGRMWAAGSGGVQLQLKEMWQAVDPCRRVAGTTHTIKLFVPGVETILCVVLRWESC